MAIINVTSMTVKASGWAKFVEDSKKAKALLEKHGARDVRVIVPLAGAASGTVAMSFEVDDLVAFGKVSQSYYEDPAMIELMMSSGDDVTWQTSVYSDLPLS